VPGNVVSMQQRGISQMIAQRRTTPKHTAWVRECLVWKIYIVKARQAYLARPSLFQIHTNM
jgi:hypothetical protein